MKKSISLILALSTLLVAAAFAVPSYAEVRFGPWVYYAPYYYPPDNQCLACVTSPLDFLPRYESPNPPTPSHDPGPLGPPMPPTKVKSQNSAAHYPSFSPTPSRPPVRRVRPEKHSLEPVERPDTQSRLVQRTQSFGEPGSRRSVPQNSFQRPQPVGSAPQALNPSQVRPSNRPMFRGQGQL